MLHFIVSKSESHKVFFSKKVKSGPMSSFNFGSHMQALAQTREMDQLGQEVHELREEVTTLRAEVEKLTNLISSLMATRDQPSCAQQPRQQAFQRATPQNQAQKASRVGPIMVKYAELFSTLLRENLIQTRLPPPMPKKYSTWYKPDLFCAFHQRAPGHDIEQCFAFRTVVRELIRGNTLSPEGQLLVQQKPQHYPANQHIAAITPATNATQLPNYQHLQPQHPQQHPQPPHQRQYQHYQQQPYQHYQQQPYQHYQQQPYQQQQPQTQPNKLPPSLGNMRINFHSCLKRIWSRPRRLLRYPQDCHHGIDLTFYVTTIKGHLAMILNIVMQ